jgi:predicted Zn-dependent protease
MELLAKFPTSELAQFTLAQAYFDERQHEKAAEMFRELVAGKPDWMVAHILLGKSLVELGKKSEARPILERALALAREQHHEGPEAELVELLKTL